MHSPRESLVLHHLHGRLISRKWGSSRFWKLLRGCVIITRITWIPQQAEAWLQKTIDETPACVETLETIRYGVQTGAGFLYVVHEDGELYGVIYASTEDNLFSFSLLGGKEFAKWKETLRQWTYKIKAEGFRVIFASRKAWKRVFPELKEIAVVYEF